MQFDDFLKELKKPDVSFLTDEPMSRHTTFRIGGNADVWICVRSVAALQAVLRTAARLRVPLFPIGCGSNLLVSDDGIEGAVVSLCQMDKITVTGTAVRCEAGAKLSALCRAAQEAGLSGLEFAFGIPGSVGGAAFMNAGAYGGEMAQVLTKAECVLPDGTLQTLTTEEMGLSYRDSVFRRNGAIVTAVEVSLTPDRPEKIRERMTDFMNRRREKQPLEYPSAGSTFKRPQGYFAGALIEKNGLKGKSVGDAQVSEKHAGFVINRGNATCRQVLQLIREVQDTVLQHDGVLLEPEVITVGKNL